MITKYLVNPFYDGIKWLVMVGVPKALDKAVRWQSTAINHLRERK